MTTIKQLKQELNHQYDSVEVYKVLQTNNIGNYHTDYVGNNTLDYSDNSIVASYRIMSPDEYDHTILANHSLFTQDMNQPDRVLIIQVY